MYKGITRVVAAVAASVALSTMGATGASASGAAPRDRGAVQEASQVPLGPGAQLWVSRYRGPVTGFNGAHSLAVSPDGRTVFVTGASLQSTTKGYDYATVAYNAATGAQLWASRYAGPGGDSRGNSVAVSPGGGTVFVTGASQGITSGFDYATVAYNATTDAQLWVSRYNGPGNGYDEASSVAVSPGGGTVFVTGVSRGITSGFDYATVAYNAATGARLWVKRYNGPGNGDDGASSLAVSPAGGTVFVTGYSAGLTSGNDYATVAYNAATGARLWVKRYNGPGNGDDVAVLVAVSPGGGRVFVTGTSAGLTSGNDYATVAYNAATGAQLWVKRYNGPGNGWDQATKLAVSPGGGRVFVTGISAGLTSGLDYATVAYNAATGAQLWVSRYSGPGNGSDRAISLAVSPSGGTVYVTGSSYSATTNDDYATVAYNAATGARLWVSRYSGPGNGSDVAFSVAVSPTGGTVFVTGTSTGTTSYEYATVAYSG